MAGSLYVQSFKKRSFVALLLSFFVLFGLISSVIAKPAQAKTVRLALVSSLQGDVTVKKGGGSKIYDAYANMSLNQGDTLYTGSDSSVVLDVSNGDSEITIGADSEFNISDLAGGSAKKSKLKIWAGSIWVKVKSLAGSNDEFDVETPTAVMGVRGTQFFVGVNPNTGKTTMAVGAGKVAASVVTYNEDGSAQQDKKTLILPTQQITLDSRDEVKDLSLKVEPIDIDSIVNSTSDKVIEAIVKDKKSIDEENAQFIEDQKKKLEQGQKDGNSNFSIKDLNDLNKITKNLDNLVGNIVKTAIDNKVIDKDKIQKVIDDANNKITDPAKKLDLSKVVPLDKSVGIDPEKEKLRQQLLKQLQEGIKKKEEEKKKQEEDLKKKLAAALKQAEEQAKKQAELNSKATQEALAKAEAELKKNLSDAEKTNFEAEKKKLEEPKKPTSSEPKVTPSTEPSTEPSGQFPSPSGSFTINNNASSTYFHTLKLALTSTNADQMNISETGFFSENNWINNASSKDYLLTDKGTGLKKIYVKLRNNFGYVTTLTPQTIQYNSPIVHATQSPVSANLVNLSLIAYESKQFRVSESAENIPTAQWHDMISGVGNLSYELLSGAGTDRTIYAQFMSQNGVLLSDIVSTHIALNASTPAQPILRQIEIGDVNTEIRGNTSGNSIVEVKSSSGTTILNSVPTNSNGEFTLTISNSVITSGTKLDVSAKYAIGPSSIASTVTIPSVGLSLPESSNSPFNVNINMSDFDANTIYGVEVHLLYGKNIVNKNSQGTHDVTHRLFNETYVDLVKEFKGSTQNELVYVITNFGSGSKEIPVFSGSKQLVSIPFEVAGIGTENISVGYIKIVRRDGSEFIIINPANIKTKPITVTPSL